MVASPNVDCATLRVDSIASISSASLPAIFIPIPPPPAAAFTMTGYPISCAPSTARDVSSMPSDMPGMTGTPAFSMVLRAVILLPAALIEALDGPMKTIPAFSHSLAKAIFSDKNPYPGWIA